MYYALTDTFTGDDPSEYSSGFANTKTAIAFRTRAQRDEWVKSSKLLTAEAITREEAIKITGWECGDYYGKPHYQVKAIRVYGETQKSSVSYENEPVYHITMSK